MYTLTLGQTRLTLLPEKAVYVAEMRSLLVADVHLGKSETFQRFGVPVSSDVNQATLDRLQQACEHVQPTTLWILGDLFHAREGMADAVLDSWLQFLDQTQVQAKLVLGNHDRGLTAWLQALAIDCFFDAVDLDGLRLSHEPWPEADRLNLCGHVHPCVRLKSRLDHLRLPCFYWEPRYNRLTLPAFGEFTGGYDVPLTAGATAYGVAEDQVIPLAKSIYL